MNLFGLIVDLLLAFRRGPSKEGAREREEGGRRRREAFERDRRSIRAQYATWARERGLRLGESEDVGNGVIGGREIRFHTGLAGETERRPKIDVSVPLDVSEDILVERGVEPGSDIERRVRVVLEKVDLLETIWLSKEGIRLAFGLRAHPDVFDAALDALEEALRSSPYR